MRFTRTKGTLGGIDDLKASGQFASHSTMMRCRQLHIDDPALLYQLFMQMAEPCLSFGCEVWCPLLSDSTTQLTGPSNPGAGILRLGFEQVHTRFLRIVLGLGSKVASWLLLAELHKAPLYMTFMRRACRYWNKLVRLPHTHIARLAFLDSIR